MFRLKTRSFSSTIIVDIGADSVGVGVARIGGAIPEFLYTHREPIKHSTHAVASADARALRAALSVAMLELSNAGMKSLARHGKSLAPSRIHLVCGTPWAKTDIRHISYSGDKQFRVTEEFAKKLIEHEGIGKVGDIEDPKIVHQNIVGRTLNGYPVKNFTGQTATDIEVSFAIEYIGREILDALNDTGRHLSPHIPIDGRSSEAVTLAILQSLYPHMTDCLICTVTGGATHIIHVERGIPLEETLGEHGYRMLLHSISKKMKTFEEEARSHLRDFIKGESHPEATGAVADVSDDFDKGFESLFSELRSKYVLPRTIFLVTEPDLAPYIESSLIRAYRAAHQVEKNVRVIALDGEKIGESVSWRDGCVRDFRLALLGRFFHMKESPAPVP